MVRKHARRAVKAAFALALAIPIVLGGTANAQCQPVIQDMGAILRRAASPRLSTRTSGGAQPSGYGGVGHPCFLSCGEIHSMRRTPRA